MYVCVCNAVSDREVKEAIERGATSVPDVVRACKAGGDCGSCHARIQRMIDGGAGIADGLVSPARLGRTRAA